MSISDFVRNNNFASSIVKRILRGSAWGVLGTGAGRILNLLAMIVAARVLGRESFGEFALVQATLGMLGMFAGAGLGATSTRFVAAHYKEDPDKAGRVVGLVVVIGAASCIVFGSAIVVTADTIASRIFDAPQLGTALRIGTILIVAGVLRGLQDSILVAFERFELIAMLRFIEGLASLIFVVMLVRSFGVNGGLLGLAAGAFIAILAGVLLTNAELSRKRVSVQLSGALSEWKLLRDYSAPALLSGIIASPVLWLAILILSRSSDGMAELGLYNAAYQWHSPMVFVPMVIASVSLPILVQEWTSGRIETFVKTFRGIVVAGGMLALMPALVAASISPWIMATYGPDFHEGWPVMVLLLLAAPLHVVANLCTSAILSINRPWSLLGLHFLWAAVLLGTTILTVHEYGAVGLGMAFLAGYFVFAGSSLAFILLTTRSVRNREINRQQC